ncbi:hypothetical protein [uncultured Subdoligranulum sp.]|uniref:hypothetical protein n=1 Tax=uncultured Subdoligranulum sp. TaxID=512298 RepID=UPI002633A311|nr:hypothetical protein [uncultured Subdoligranulum sp.]
MHTRYGRAESPFPSPWTIIAPEKEAKAASFSGALYLIWRRFGRPYLKGEHHHPAAFSPPGLYRSAFLGLYRFAGDRAHRFFQAHAVGHGLFPGGVICLQSV